jgi:lysophospholipase L1-like esterase
MQNFRRNLTNIVRMAKENGVLVVIGTVPSNLVKPSLTMEGHQLWPEIQALYDRGEWQEAKKRSMELVMKTVRHQSSDEENAIIREVAAAEGIPLADVERAITEAEPNKVPGETMFSDHCHLNPEGNRILIETFEQVLLQALKGGAQ